MPVKSKSTHYLYPLITIDRIKRPSRVYAIPIVGFLIKTIIVWPIGVELSFLYLANSIILFVNSFAVLFTGRYWTIAYELSVGIMRLETKVFFFLFGLMDEYPGFSLSSKTVSFAIDFPSRPHRGFAIPIFGGLARLILLIPFLIYAIVMRWATALVSMVGSFYVLFTGKYPESVYEFVLDTNRLLLSISSYFFSGISDTYPNFQISMNHKMIKIIAIILSSILVILYYGSYFSGWASTFAEMQNQSPKMRNMQVQPSMQPSHNSY